MANEALKIWKFPEKYQTAAVTENNFTFEDDFEKFTGTKPNSVFISDKEIKIKNWRDLLQEILNFFYRLDENIFRQALQKENIPQRVKENFAKSNLGNIALSTMDSLRNAKKFVENFDSIGGSNFKDEILFTIQK